VQPSFPCPRKPQSALRAREYTSANSQRYHKLSVLSDGAATDTRPLQCTAVSARSAALVVRQARAVHFHTAVLARHHEPVGSLITYSAVTTLYTALYTSSSSISSSSTSSSCSSTSTVLHLDACCSSCSWCSRCSTRSHSAWLPDIGNWLTVVIYMYTTQSILCMQG
jgi:hypothetical protein